MVMRSKVRSLQEAAALVGDGAVLAIGGNIIHRVPAALVRELVRQGRRGLEVVKTAGGYEGELLAAFGCLRRVHTAYVGFENELGLAPAYRRAVEQGEVEVREHACPSVIAGLRAAAYGVPFMPVAGFAGSDIPGVSDFARVADPFGSPGDEPVLVVKRIEPDWALIHVQEADARGNARILGSPFEDLLMARAAKGVILTAERVFPAGHFRSQPESVGIPHYLVQAVVEAPRGAYPCSCYPYYGYDAEEIRDLQQRGGEEEWRRHYLARAS